MKSSQAVETKWFSHEELKQLLGAVAGQPRNIALLQFLLDTGVHLGELCRLTIEDIDLSTGKVIVKSFGPDLKGRTVHMGETTRRSMRVYLASTHHVPTDSLFGMQEAAVRQLLKRIGQTASVENVYPQRFRHTFAHEYLNSTNILGLSPIMDGAQSWQNISVVDNLK